METNALPLADPAMFPTPPEEDRFNLNEFSGSLSEDSDSRPHKSSAAEPFDSALGRIYRYTPVPTLVLDPSLHIVEVSESHQTLSDQPRDRWLDRSICDVSPRLIPAPDFATLYGVLRVATSTRSVQVIDGFHVEECRGYYSLRVTPIFEGFTLLYVVLEAHNVTKDYIQSVGNRNAYLSETYKILLDTVRDYAIFMLDTRGNIATWNSGAAVIKGYSASEIVGKHFSVFYGEEDRASDKPGRELDVCLREGKVEDEGWRYRQDGSRFWANVLITPIYQFGRHVGFVKVSRDLTERKAAESRMIAAFEESSKMKTDFLANMSHEIRTPMNGMNLALAMLTDTDLNEQQREMASIIQDSTSILLEVINDVLDYSKLSSGSFSLTADVLDIKAVLAAVTRNCNSSLKPGVKLINSIAPEVPKHLRGDPLRYRQVLQNMISNAVKFTDEGYVKVITSCLTKEKNPQTYEILTEVIDTGIGVPEESASTLFTPFTRFADSSTKRYQGTGLGLSICKSLAELMDGAVGFRPNPEGRGSVFWFTAKMSCSGATGKDTLPGTVAQEDAKQLEAKVKTIAPQKQLMLVEDNLVNQMVMLRLLKKLGFERVDTAWNGAEAVRLVKQTPLSYNAILMDITMPVMDGMEATTCIRNMNIDVPVIALTGNALEGDEETYLAKGMNDYLAKPVHRNQLTRTLLKWIGP